ncbi:MAG: M3 family metallopeptidase [Pirellulaceae bacterium]
MALVLLATVATGPIQAQEQTQEKTQEQSVNESKSEMLKPWSGPYGGVPPWNVVRQDEFVAAFDAAIAEAQREIADIANNPEPATFDNTIVALEKAGHTLERLDTLFGVHSSNLNVGPMPDIERAVSPKLAAYQDSITQNEKLFARIEAVYQSDQRDKLSLAQRRLLDDRYRNFVRQGAKLEPEAKKKLSQINMRLASLFTDFSQNVLHDEQAYVTWVTDKDDLAGLPNRSLPPWPSAAKERGKPDQWAVLNTRSSMDPFLTYVDNRKLREEVWRTYYNRGDNGDEYDNNTLIAEILRLRRTRANMLGYPTHAHWRLENTMAKTPEATMDLMMKVWPKAVARVEEEVADMQKIADQEGANIKIEPWDYRYYAEKVRKAKYDLDFNE